MATPREDNAYEGGGAGGKFRKKPFRMTTRSTPYDRPQTALRNPSANTNTINNGWFSKLVDPAQRLITSGAHRLFSSVFRKRLPPPPPPQPPEQQIQTEAYHEAAWDKHQEDVMRDPVEVQGAVNRVDNQNHSSDGGGFPELEHILKQKTFTRYEIDRITALLHSRTVDMPVRDIEKPSQVVPSKPLVAHELKEEILNTPAQENGTKSDLIATPAGRSSVLEESVASPAELAKAYMGSRSSKVSPTMLGLRSQAFKENSNLISNQPLPLKSPIMSLVPRSSGHAVIENGFVTPRSRGRSALYSMARTPYSRVHLTTTVKSNGRTVDAYGGPSSSSQSAWEQNKLSGAKQGALKRRISIFDNDIGSGGPTRRIRQKPNLLSLKNLSLPVSGTLSGMEIGSNAAQRSSSLLLDEGKRNSTTMLTENGVNSIPSTSFTAVPSKSSETASKILQQLEKFSPKKIETTPSKLSPSMLLGQARKSLENPDSPNYLEFVEDDKKLDGSIDTLLPPEVRDSTSQKKDKVEESDPTKIASFSKSIPADTVKNKGTVSGVKAEDSCGMNSVPQKKRAFKMSAFEDSFELDDDSYSNGVAYTLPEQKDDWKTPVVESKTMNAVTTTAERPPAFADVNRPQNQALNYSSKQGASDGFVVTEKSSNFTFPTVSSPSNSVEAVQSTLTYNKSASDGPAPIFDFGDKDTSLKETHAASSIFNLPSKNLDRIPAATFTSSSLVTESSGLKFGSSSDPKPESLSSIVTVAASVIDSIGGVRESEKPNTKDILKAGVLVKIPEIAPTAVSTSSSTPSMFIFGSPANGLSQNNGPLASNSSSLSTPSSPFVDNNSSQNSTNTSVLTSTVTTTSSSAIATTTTGSAIATTAVDTATPFSSSFSTTLASPVFKFGSSMVRSTTVSAVPAASGVEPVEAMTKQDTSFGSLTTNAFDGTSAALASTGSGIFSFSAGAMVSSSAANGAQSLAFSGSSGSLLTAQASPSGTGVAAFTQSMPVQFAPTTSPTSFGLVGNTSNSSGSSLFDASTAANSSGSSPFCASTPANPSSAFGVPASSSQANSSASSSSATSSLFASSWQPNKSPVFSSSSASTGLAFGSSSTSNTAVSSAPMVFGSSNGSSGSIFPYMSGPSTSSQPAFGNSNPLPFSSTPSSNNDQVNMEDSMAEDTVQASMPTVPVFGQPTTSQPPSVFGQPTTSQTPLVFGQPTASQAPSSFVFGSQATTPAVNPFAFAGQQNPIIPQNPSPFQASGQNPFASPFQASGQNASPFQASGQNVSPFQASGQNASPFQASGQNASFQAPGQNPSAFQASGSLGGSFSLGTSGGDKGVARRIVRVKHKPRKK